MREILAARGIRLTRSLGQNFLHDGHQLQRIVAAAELRPTDRVLEIGPGLGPLTELLVAEAGEVAAIEMDARLCSVLRERLAGASRLHVREGDALALLRAGAIPLEGWKVVSNLPYSVASPILVELALAGKAPDWMVVTLQWEVAQRIVAGAGDEDYGLLTLLVQLRFVPRGLFRIPPGCFFPAPDVDSACLTLARRPEELLPAARRGDFTRLVKLAFSQRRKMMLKLLKQRWPAETLERAFAEVGLSATLRAEAVSLEQFVRLTLILPASSTR